MAERKLGRGLDSLLGVGPATDAEQLVELGIEEVRSSPHQPREDFNEARLKELASSIRESGLLQPVLVRPAAGGYEIVAGERRVRAARMAGKTTVPAIVREYSDEQVMVLSLVENVQRDDLNAIEKARAYRRLQQILGGTQEDVAERVGVDPSSVSNMIRLLDLSPPLQELVQKDGLSMGHARALLGLETDDARLALARRIIKEGLSVRAAEELVRSDDGVRAQHRKRPRKTAEVAALEVELRRALGTKVKIEDRRGKGRIVIEYYSPAEFERVSELLKSSTETGFSIRE